MIFLDTHVVVWLYQKEQNKFTPQGLAFLESGKLVCSPAVNLELQYLYEIDRITAKRCGSAPLEISAWQQRALCRANKRSCSPV